MNENNPLIKHSQRPATLVPAVGAVKPNSSFKPSVVTQPTPPPTEFTSQQDSLINRLLSLPRQIEAAQAEFDKHDFYYREALATITIRAFSEPLFPGKKDGEGLRAASNDTEREAAIQRLATTNERIITSADLRNIALRELMRLKNEFEATKLIALLMISSSKQG